MSDTPEGPNWWMAQDGRWYPPEQHPQYVAPASPPPPQPPQPPPPQPAAMAPIQDPGQVPMQSAQMLVSIGDIAVYQDRVVTPSGTYPHQGLTWVVRDNTTVSETIPTYAIVLAIIFALACLLGLFFLLIKEKKIHGYVEVSVQSATGFHVTQVPVTTSEQIALIRQQVDYARGLGFQG